MIKEMSKFYLYNTLLVLVFIIWFADNEKKKQHNNIEQETRWLKRCARLR